MSIAAVTAAAGSPTPAIAATGETVHPAGNSSRHLGVGSCGNSVCHGKQAPQTGRNVALNEYTIWLEKDPHAKAYTVLDKPLAKSIASKLGLANASTAKECLDCHADNVPASERGPKFQLRDGIGCEACHGGSERWIKTHSQKDASHARNLSLGMYPTEQPARRAQLCLSCHFGTLEKFATHRLIGAGHPRLQFELDAFSANQQHYRIDATYFERKGKIDDMKLWVAGQLEGELVYLSLLQSPLFVRPGLIPELAFYDCFACHHSIDKDKLRWTRERAGPGVPPGTLRLQKQHLLMLQAVAEAIGDKGTAAALAGAGNSLTLAAQTDVTALRDDARRLAAQLHAMESWTHRAFSHADIAAARKKLLTFAAEDRASDYLDAEQVCEGVDGLSIALDDHERRLADINALYTALNANANFEPAQFRKVAKEIVGRF